MRYAIDALNSAIVVQRVAARKLHAQRRMMSAKEFGGLMAVSLDKIAQCENAIAVLKEMK